MYNNVQVFSNYNFESLYLQRVIMYNAWNFYIDGACLVANKYLCWVNASIARWIYVDYRKHKDIVGG